MFGRTSPQPMTPGMTPGLAPGLTEGIPDAVPVLSRGRHRHPRKGACFMEMASYLAGERWSDHPDCTHPVLASLARCVNDALGDEHRQELAWMIPDVVGLNPDDRAVAPTVMRRAALAALPIAASERQNTMALALIAAEHELARLGGGRDVLSREARHALDCVPAAEHWAREFAQLTGEGPPRPDAAPRVIALAVAGIAAACVDDAPGRLVALLRQAIDEVSALAGDTHEPRYAARPAHARQRSSAPAG